MSKDRRQQKHRCTMMLEKNKNDQTQRKGSNVHEEQKQQVAKQKQINNRTETTNGFKNANKDLSTNIASNTLKKTEKQRKHEQTHTHRTERNNTIKQTHREPKTESETRTHTQEATTNQYYLFRKCTKTTAN